MRPPIYARFTVSELKFSGRYVRVLQMNRIHLQITTLVCLFIAGVAYAQSSEPAAISAVPKLVRFSGSVPVPNGLPIQSVESVTLAVYRDQSGGAPLWQEIQNVAVDSEGHYSVVLGATHNEGMPLDLFTSGEPRWLGVQLNRPGETEQPRVLLVSVPYALKASDAETLGGKPASAYLLAPSAATSVGDGTANSSTSSSANGIATSANVGTAVKPRTVSGQIDRVAKFIDGANDVGNSSLYDANGLVGISTAAPLISLDVRTGSLPQMGIAGTTDYLTFFASDAFGPAIYWDPAKDMRFGKGGSGLYNPFGFVEQMRIQSSTGNVGIGTQAPGSKLDVNGSVNMTGSLRYLGSPVLQLPAGIENIGLGILALSSNTIGNFNTAIGNSALQNNTTGSSNTATGLSSLRNNTTGIGNTADGASALGSNTNGSDNTAIGAAALAVNTTGGANTATGEEALLNNTTGSFNTASGYSALSQNQTGDGSTAIGYEALKFNSTGPFNTAAGYQALHLNTTGGANTAMGSSALVNNSAGNSNTAIGVTALSTNTTGSGNTAIGASALFDNETGLNNTASGTGALLNNVTGNNNTAMGLGALSNNIDGSGNIGIGYQAGSVFASHNNSIYIGNAGAFGDANATIRIGTGGTQFSFFAAGIRGVTTGANDAIPVVIDSSGQLGTVSSSRRFKDDIADMGEASRGLMRLRPVTYRYKKPFADGSKPIQYGLIAEEVSEVYPDLVAHSADGQIETVKYQVLDSMLLNEVQRQQAEIRGLEEENRVLKERLDKLEKILTAISR